MSIRWVDSEEAYDGPVASRGPAGVVSTWKTSGGKGKGKDKMTSNPMFTVISPDQLVDGVWRSISKTYGVIDLHEFAWDELHARLEDAGICYETEQTISQFELAEYQPVYLVADVEGKPGLILGDLIYRRGRVRLPSDPPSPFAQPEPLPLEREREV